MDEMTSVDVTRTETGASGPGKPWGLWWRQVRAILRIETRKSFLGRRALLLYLVALLPLGIVAAFDVGVMFFSPEQETVGWATQEFYSNLYQGLILRMVVFFGCLWVFMNLFRGEVMDRSLHYYFLAPVRRSVLVVGKFLAGVMATFLLFGGSTLLSYLLVYIPFGSEAISQHLFGGPGLSQMLTYLGITFLACLGYGAVFLLLGLLFKNPIFPAVGLFLWEWIHWLLPGFLKKLTVLHYLKPLSPVPFEEGLFAMPSDPPSTWVSVGGLIAFAALLLFLSAVRARRMEISYGDD